mmetsp:Transcript_10657/g.14759  ORF Transcript_10657/g.14759 Transcript_10657/m.14759 type:complete len:82 (-) Transcript_10657:1212-1457(-)
MALRAVVGDMKLVLLSEILSTGAWLALVRLSAVCGTLPQLMIALIILIVNTSLPVWQQQRAPSLIDNNASISSKSLSIKQR